MEPGSELSDFEEVTIAETSTLVVLYSVEAADAVLEELLKVLAGYAETCGVTDLDLQRSVRDTRRDMARFIRRESERNV